MPRIALVTCSELAELDDDDRLLLRPLADRGIDAVPAVWDDPAVDWSSFDLAVLRSTWDYTSRRDAFVSWASSVPRLLNPAEVVRWNTDKRYLRELEDAGVPVVSTWWLTPGDRVILPGEKTAPSDALAIADEYVVKPAVSAGSLGAGRYRADEPSHRDLARAHVTRLLDRGATVMIQPYLSAVDAFGETAMLFLAGEFSHAIRKGPMLSGPDDGEVRLYRPEQITRRSASDVERKTADAVLAAVPGSDDLLYARVDLIPGPDGTPVVLELELSEPSLFLGHDAAAPQRFADAIASRC
ncbi:ATP-grasp domain-containing protein [Phytoactinopolyspora halotolerans]|uniref:ATP-grasp domain-containing protein n=1 Tax=Phytoactinopolyspora halotolerans TaxID=1981512 RepID=A0A6L9SEY0_9ACTN|nr:hypothetical protein [Phytoactinopolyspora halotolerans]NEE03214.1 hypothetical protein [Phytoactinopolyspora halotolerans]